MKKHKYRYRDRLSKIKQNFLYSKNYEIMKKNINLKNSLRQKIIISIFIKNCKINTNNLKKFCIMTGRLRSIVHSSKLNRLNFREITSKGLIPGVYKK